MIKENRNSNNENVVIMTDKDSKRNVWLAGIFNWIVPGLGYYYCGKFRLGIIIGLFSPVLFILLDYVSFLLPSKFNIVLVFSSYIIVSFFFAIHAFFIARKINEYSLKYFNKHIFYILFLCIGIIYKSTVIDSNSQIYTMNSEYMENTILKNDYVFISRNSYGIYIPIFDTKILSFYKPVNGEIVYYRILNFENNKEQSTINRIIGIPGDTVRILNKICYINSKPENYNEKYIYDKIKRDTLNIHIYPKGANWNEDNYGPLYIPKKGDVLKKINKENIWFYEQLIFKDNQLTKNDQIISNILKNGEYTIKHNYYFALGDNRNYSDDSRFLGLVSEDEILGKPEFILFNKNNLFDFFSENSRSGIKIH